MVLPTNSKLASRVICENATTEAVNGVGAVQNVVRPGATPISDLGPKRPMATYLYLASFTTLVKLQCKKTTVVHHVKNAHNTRVLGAFLICGWTGRSGALRNCGGGRRSPI